MPYPKQGSRSRLVTRIAAGAALIAALPVVTAARPEPTPDPVAALTARQADGETVYRQTCMACHQTTGQGVPGAFPPLAGSEWVNGDKGRVVRIILHGLTGTVAVAGEEYEGMMPPWGAALGDPQIAAVASYVRSSWGNKGDAVTAAEVAAIRQETAGRSAPWTVAELMAATTTAAEK